MENYSAKTLFLGVLFALSLNSLSAQTIDDSTMETAMGTNAACKWRQPPYRYQ
jgi:hypothetical protein